MENYLLYALLPFIAITEVMIVNKMTNLIKNDKVILRLQVKAWITLLLNTGLLILLGVKYLELLNLSLNTRLVYSLILVIIYIFYWMCENIPSFASIFKYKSKPVGSPLNTFEDYSQQEEEAFEEIDEDKCIHVPSNSKDGSKNENIGYDNLTENEIPQYLNSDKAFSMTPSKNRIINTTDYKFKDRYPSSMFKNINDSEFVYANTYKLNNSTKEIPEKIKCLL